MGALASHLQRLFIENCPSGWGCRHEVAVLSDELSELLGYTPRADVVLEKLDGSRRLWIEFEVSRADPVANHAKFATAHLFEPQGASDSFVSMVSAHVDRGRRNLAACAIPLMRHVGMSAFQTMLLPFAPADEIKRLNHLSLFELEGEPLRVEDEINRVFAVSESVLQTPERRIYFVGEMTEVLLNLRRWNLELATPEGRTLWKRRTVTYFVFDPRSKLFAPSKFCAFSAVGLNQARSEMTLALYSTLDGTDSRFDGRRAWMHFSKNLAMTSRPLSETGAVQKHFAHWLEVHADAITVHPSGPIILVGPQWFR